MWALRRILMLLSLAPLIYSGLAFGASDEEWAACTKGSPEARIAGCTAIIESGKEHGRNASSAHTNRAVSYAALRRFEEALKDHNRAIDIWPQNPSGYSARGTTYEAKGDIRLAKVDYRAALSLPLIVNSSPLAHETARMRLAALETEDERKSREEQNARLKEGKSAELASKPVGEPTGPRVALVVGNSNYIKTAALPNPRNDAVAIAAALRGLGFQVIEAPDVDIAALASRVRDFARILKGAELGLFFYAGHGLQVNGVNYIVPIDATLNDEGDVAYETIEVNDVLKQMERQAKTNVVILDACRNNPLARNLMRSMGTRSASLGSGLAEVKSGIGTLVAFATQPGNVALDGAGNNSPFTTALLKHLATPNLDIGDLLRRVRKDVIDTTAGRQVPWDHSSLTGPLVLRWTNKS